MASEMADRDGDRGELLEDEVIARVEVNNGQIEVKIPCVDGFEDYTCGPSLGLGLSWSSDDNGAEIVLNYLDLTEQSAERLITALRSALEIERARAAARYHYEWVAAGRPDIDVDSGHSFFQDGPADG